MKRLLFLLLASSAFAAQQTVSWIYSGAPITGFVLERGTGPNAQTFKAVATLPATARFYLNTGLYSKTKYAYRLRAFIETPDGLIIYSAYSNVVSKPAK